MPERKSDMPASNNVEPLPVDKTTGDENAWTDTTVGALLMEAGTLTEEDIQRILKYSGDFEVRFGEAAIKLGLATKDDIKHALARQFDYPYLKPGVGGFGKELIAAYQPFTPRVESLRSLRMQLMMRWFAAGHGALAVVSPGNSEGRSYVTANLGIVFSQLGDRTLLIDANLQKPRLHEIFRIDNSTGLSPALVGRTGGKLNIAEIPHFENLSVLPAGAIPPNPDELLARNEFEEILGELSTEYDIILIDTPPGDSGIGAQTVSYRCGGALLVTRRHRTSFTAAREFTDRLRARAQVVGSVLNTF